MLAEKIRVHILETLVSRLMTDDGFKRLYIKEGGVHEKRKDVVTWGQLTRTCTDFLNFPTWVHTYARIAAAAKSSTTPVSGISISCCLTISLVDYRLTKNCTAQALRLMADCC